jgi:hypothetical protein
MSCDVVHHSQCEPTKTTILDWKTGSVCARRVFWPTRSPVCSPESLFDSIETVIAALPPPPANSKQVSVNNPG